MQFGILGAQAPELRVDDWIDAHGAPTSPFTLSNHDGKVRVIYCFQAWCPGCHSRGFPTLKALTSRFDNSEDVAFAVIQTTFEGHSSNGGERRREQQLKYGLNIPFGQDESAPRPRTMEDYRTGGTPWFIIIGRNQKVIFNGYHIELKQAETLIQAAIDQAHDTPEPCKDFVRYEPQNNRYVVEFYDGGQGRLDYSREGHTLYLNHTEVPAARRGQGLGGRMMERVMEAIEADGLKVVPVCSYTRNYLSRYQRWAPLVEKR